MVHYTVPGLSETEATRSIGLLQDRLHACNDLQLTLKHVHWNLVGPQFMAVHVMLDPQVDAVRAMVDELAERIATLGASPNGTPGSLVAERRWDDYAVGRATVREHLSALDDTYRGVIASHRSAIDELDKLDLVSQDILIGHAKQLELFHWFIRAHLEDPGGRLVDAGEGNMAQQGGTQ